MGLPSGLDGIAVTMAALAEAFRQILRNSVSVDAILRDKLAITFADPALEKRRQALLQDNFSATRKAGVPGVGKAPPPAARAGRLRSLAQAEALQIERVVAAVTPQGPAPAPTPALSELACRKAKLQAELSVKKRKDKPAQGAGSLALDMLECSLYN